MLILILGLILFFGIHTVRIAAPQWREAQIAKIGAGPWRGLYSLISAVGFVLIVWGYSRARLETTFLYDPPVWLRHIAILLMLISFICLMVYVFPAGRLKPLLKHPMLAAVKTWAVAHLLANGDSASVILFGVVLAWAVADRISVGRRGLALPAPGPVTWDIAAVVVGAALWGLFIWRLHVWLIGVSPL